MKPREFAVGVKEMFVDDSIETYRKIYYESMTANYETQYCKDIKSVFSKLNLEEQEAFFNLLKIVCIDSVNSFFSLLDGSSGLVGQSEPFKLISMDESQTVLSGNLMACFDEVLQG